MITAALSFCADKMVASRADEASRLLELPPELRLIIYSWVLRGYGLFSDNSASGDQTCCLSIANDTTEFTPHPLMHVCSFLRQEFAPAFYSALEIAIDSSDSGISGPASIFSSWTQDIVGPWTRHLTKLSVFHFKAAQRCRVDIFLDAPSGDVRCSGLLEVSTGALVSRSPRFLINWCNTKYRGLDASDSSLFVKVATHYLRAG